MPNWPYKPIRPLPVYKNINGYGIYEYTSGDNTYQELEDFLSQFRWFEYARECEIESSRKVVLHKTPAVGRLLKLVPGSDLESLPLSYHKGNRKYARKTKTKT